MGFAPRLWASLLPRDSAHPKPNHYLEMLKIAWRNRDQLPYAARILRKGTCDGCALGTAGIRDWTIDGIHLCLVRLELMRFNTAPALDPGCLRDVSRLGDLDSAALRDLGRVPEPLLRRAGEAGFRVVSWDEAYAVAADAIRAVTPERVAFYLTSRGILNEHYYAAQKAARAIGTNHVDNSARLCHAASTVGMKRSVGYGATTCSYSDWIGTDLIVFFGSNPANNQPVTTKYLYEARRAGTRVAMVNPYRERAMERYWIPSVTESAIFGTRLAEERFAVDTGGDLAFLNGVLKILIAEDWIDRGFIEQRTVGFAETADHVAAQEFDRLERESGTTRAEMHRFARLLAEARNGIFVWSMGLTQHAHGVDTVVALMNVGLARGWVGREKVGMMPIRGHSGVQGGAEVGCVPSVGREQARRYADTWGFEWPAFDGLTAAEMVAAAHEGRLDVFWITGGNFMETLPDPSAVATALGNVRTRVHQDVVLTSMMLVPPRDAVLLLPATTRYESPGGGTETTTERRIIFSPEVPGRRIGSAKPEWEVFAEVAARVRPDRAGAVRFSSSQAIRDEIARAVPLYAGIETLSRFGDQFQWGGPRLYGDGHFATADGKAHFNPVTPPDRRPGDGAFFVSTRRGKQFNSIVQARVDPLTRAAREDILMASSDAQALGLSDGSSVRLRSSCGVFEGRVRIDDVKPGNLEVHWPEGNVLLDRQAIDRASREPDYNAVVRVERV